MMPSPSGRHHEDEDDTCHAHGTGQCGQGSLCGRDDQGILEEFIAATGYHEKSAIRVLNSHPEPRHRQTRQRPSLYEEAARGALIVLWEASDRVCGKRLVVEPTIRLRPNDNTACASCLAPQIDPSDECFVLLAGKSTWKLDTQLLEELRGVDVGEFLQSAANDRPHYAERLDTGLASLGVDRLRLLLHLRGCRGRGGWDHRLERGGGSRNKGLCRDLL